MRIQTLFAALALAPVLGGACGPAPTTPLALCSTLGPKSTSTTPASREEANASRVAGLALLGSVTQLLSPLGRPVMAANLATTVAINNHATPALRAQALADAQITNENANTLADGLGATLGEIYRAGAAYQSPDDGKTAYCGQVGPAVTALIHAVNATSRGDAAAGKFGYADQKISTFPLPPGGVYNVIGQAYNVALDAKGADPHGDPRPFQTAPPGAVSGPRITTYEGTDFFCVPSHSLYMLEGVHGVPGRTGSNLTDSPSFPSGHTTFGYSEALILAMMVPERYRALAYRGSEYGNSRIVIGAHYAIDVIGGRTLATYDLAQDLAGTKGYAKVDDTPFRTTLARAATEFRAHLQAALKDKRCASIASCAARDPIVRADNASVFRAGMPQPATTGEAFRFRLTYGLPPMGRDNLPPEPVPVEAATLLATRFPYLTPAQRLDVLRSTEGPSGHFLDVNPRDGAPLLANGPGPRSQAGAYSRLDLYAAAGGFASFADQVVVDQDATAIKDPDLAPFLDFARTDTWSNDIGGAGGLTKRGAGRLILAGANTYAGATIVAGGTLDVAGAIGAPIKVERGGTLAGAGKVGEVAVEPRATLAPGDASGQGALAVAGSLNLAPGATYALAAAPTAEGATRIAGSATIEGAHLLVKAGATLRPGTRVAVLTARGGVQGRFADATLETGSGVARLAYDNDAVYLTLEAKKALTAPD